MNEPRDPNETLAADATADADAESGAGRAGAGKTTNPTVDFSSLPADSLEVGLAAAFGKAPGPPRSSLGNLRRVLLKEAEGESSLVVKPTSDAMPLKDEAGDRYRFDGEIARGGMGAVLRGRDIDLGRDLAIKVLLEKFANRPDVARRFIEEAQIGGQLQHPGVVPVYDIGRFGDRPFFTMKLVKGQTLAAILSEREQPTDDRPRLLGIALQVSQAMAYAHAKGVIHRDLKPANIMVGAFGEVQVMDWGLAKVLAEGGIHDEERASRAHQEPQETVIRTARSTGSHGTFGTDTEAGSVLGTPAYMPPEQASGDIALLDRRADVFGLGAILCEILTGKPPYMGRSSEEVRRKAANGDLADATARLDACGADPELIALIRKCLSPEAIDRPRDAQGVADGLSDYLNGVQERLQTAERERAVALVREAEERKRRKVQLALAASVGLLLLGGGAVAWWQNVQAGARRETDLRRQLVDEQRSAADNARLARNAEAVAALLGQAEEALKADDAAKAVVALEAAKKRSAEGGAEKEAVRLERLVADLALLRDLDAIDQFRWTLAENKFRDPAVVATRTREALRRFGADPDTVSVDEAAARVSASVVRERIVSALDRLLMPIRLVEWDKLSAEKPKVYTPQLRAAVAATLPKTPQVRALLRRVDADAYRDAVRDAVLAEDRAKFVELAGQEAALEQPPGFAVFLGGSKAIPVERRRQLLASAVSRSSGDLNLLMALGDTYPTNQKDGVDERLRWCQAAVATAPANAAAHNNLGTALAEKGQLDAAIACFKKAIELDPKFASAHSNLGSVLTLKGQLDDAIACHKKAIELDPKFASAHSNLGLALEAKGQLDDAIACYKKAIELDPKFASAQDNMGNTLKDKGQMDDAIACYRKAIELDPKFARVHYNLGLALKAKGQMDDAIACYRKAIELDPKDAMAHNNLGIAMHGKGQLDEAIACWKKAIELDPKNAGAHNNLGNALRAKGQLDAAIACYKKAIELDPKDARVHYNLGVALKDKGQLDDAIACYKKAIELDPKNAMAHNDLGIAMYGKGQVDEAIASFKKAIELDPKLAAGHYSLGTALAEKGQLDAAIACYKKAIELDPKLAMAHNNLGNALKAKGQLDDAIACYKKAIELDPKLANAHNNLGVALKAKGQLDAAIACYKTAIELDPKYAPAHDNLGGILCEVKRDYDGAIACFKKAIELEPKIAAGHCNLGNALANKGQLDAAIACYKKAIELDPKLAKAHYNLGNVLTFKGQLDDAIACYKKAIELDPKIAGARTQLASAQRLAAARDKWPAFQNGSYTPTSNEERLGLAGWCAVKKLNRSAADLYAAAFAADPKLADDLKAGHRYNAACHAALAAASQGDDAAQLDDAERIRLRKQALEWLRVDLALRTKQLESGKPADRSDVQRTMRHWQIDTDLAGIRDAAALARLPADEQKACTQLWANVAALLKQANAPPSLASLLAQLPEARRALPKDSPQLAGLLALIGLGLLEQKKWTEAEPLLRECLAIREQTQPDVWSTFNTRSLLGGALLGQQKYADAEPLLLAGYEGMKQREKTIPEQGKIRLPDAVERLVQLYEATGKTDEAAKWRKELEAIKALLKKAEEKPH